MRPVFDKSKGPIRQDKAGAAASSEGLQAFPVLQGATHNTYQPLAWQALTELRDAVGKYGLGSAEVMQVLRYFNASLLMPFDIRSLARTLFPPVKYDIFEHKWTQLAFRAVEWNATLGPGDPRRMVNPDMLMGTGNYTRAEGQAGFEPLVQEQCQQTGMAALVQTLQLATPQQSFATIVQGVDESFLCFAGWLTAAVEKQFGKRNVEREGETRADTNVSASAPTNGDLLSRLAASTHGSAGVDVCTAKSVVIDSEKIHKVPLDAFGPLGDGMSAFLMGKSSATIQGIMVHLGLIVADFSGQIHAMVSTPTPPLTIPKGTQIAQLVPFKSSVSRTEDRSRGDGGFGSTGPPQVRWTAVLTKDRPETLCTVSMAGATPSEIHLCSLLDTRADVDRPIWENQWPLPHDKLVALHELVQAQLDQGHLEPSTSPWNTPVFCIKKKSGKWRLLQDLRKINALMEGMGTLQVGIPSPTMLPADWPVLIVDLKDCFFTIPLHPDDRPKFAFTVPTINNAEPAQWYQWKFLPQGMQNFPVLCQWYVARALSGVRKQFPDAHIYHYMDDILVAAPTQDELLRIQPQLLNALHSHGLQVAPEKVQQQPPWKYLGVKILERTIRHQEVQFVQSLKTLNDAQKLASDGEQQPRAKVRVRNLVTKQWEGPYDLIAMGRGYVCVSTDTGTRWLPSKCVRPDLRPQRQNSADRQGGSRDQLESHQVDESSSDHSDDSSTDSD
ncbi:hypothetical protein DUI87_01486 [Hirundo rustica rustica]|uniref:ribonuclease H n=1 Tax=Hirundo rustica rustica TaxID=333673 RepID=A0A3M0L9J1_HIRRU|nr:hypothetical protein DUI87_01486 [Hirundo rustica rustica]